VTARALRARDALTAAAVVLSGVAVLLAGAWPGAPAPSAPAETAPPQPTRALPGGYPSGDGAEPARTAPAASAAVPPPRGSTAALAEDGCAIAEPGSSPWGPWAALSLPHARVALPLEPPTDAFDLVVHFHGGEAVRRLLAPVATDRTVIAAIDAGPGSRRYEETFAGAPLELLATEVAARLSPARRRRLVVTAWSAGYAAVRELLRQGAPGVDVFVLLDAVHASYGPDGATPLASELAPFLDLAARAAAGEAVMVLTHSEIRPPGYAATSEVADAIVAHLGGRRRYAGLVPAAGVESKTRFEHGALRVLGFTGTGPEAHCAHLRMLPVLLREALAALPPR
jgi:hypothetical protein